MSSCSCSVYNTALTNNRKAGFTRLRLPNILRQLKTKMRPRVRMTATTPIDTGSKRVEGRRI